LLRWSRTTVEGLVLADSPIVVFTDVGPSVLTDGGGDHRAEADPDVAFHAARSTWPRQQVAMVLMASNGVARGLDGLFADWSAVRDLATSSGPEAVLDQVRVVEDDTSQRHDQALVVADFT
jgi:hypothetical protein